MQQSAIPEPAINPATLFAWYGEAHAEARFFRELAAAYAARIAELEARLAPVETGEPEAE